jgi:hypothetical protein
MLMIGTIELARQIYGAWREAAPANEDPPPSWEELPDWQKARWRYTAGVTGRVLADAMGAHEASQR